MDEVKVFMVTFKMEVKGPAEDVTLEAVKKVVETAFAEADAEDGDGVIKARDIEVKEV